MPGPTQALLGTTRETGLQKGCAGFCLRCACGQCVLLGLPWEQGTLSRGTASGGALARPTGGCSLTHIPVPRGS